MLVTIGNHSRAHTEVALAGGGHEGTHMWGVEHQQFCVHTRLLL
jgi:hypothetical protein